MFQRNLILPKPGTETFFLWGPRQTGKSTLLRETYGDGHWVDLLKAEEFRRYVVRPELLRQEIAGRPFTSPAAELIGCGRSYARVYRQSRCGEGPPPPYQSEDSSRGSGNDPRV